MTANDYEEGEMYERDWAYSTNIIKVLKVTELTVIVNLIMRRDKGTGMGSEFIGTYTIHKYIRNNPKNPYYYSCIIKKL